MRAILTLALTLAIAACASTPTPVTGTHGPTVYGINRCGEHAPQPAPGEHCK
jgi:hypothetical protein